MAGLEVQIGADVTDLKKKIKEAEHTLQEFANEKAVNLKLGLDTSEVDKHIKSTKSALNDLKTTLKDTGNVIGKDFTQKTGNGGNALMQFSRIAQDAPFGIMGIGNNITATVEAFGHLKQSTGSTGSALKAVASSMLGSGGILLAVSLVTSGLTYMSQNGLTVGDVFNKLTGDFDGTARAMRDLNAEAAKNAQAEISKMNAYVSVAKDVNLSMSDRLIAVKKLQDEYPAYFGNLSKEQILNGQVATAIKGVTSALIAKAKAAAAVDKIVKLAEEEEILQEKINDAMFSMAKFYKLGKKEGQDFYTVLNKQLRGQIDLLGELEKGNANNLTKTEKQALAAIQYSQTLQDLGTNLITNISLQDKYTQKINENTAAQMKLETVVPKTKSKKTNTKEPIKKFGGSELETGGLVDVSGKVVQIAKNVQGAEGLITTSLKNINVAFDMSGVAMLETLNKFNDDLSNIVNNGIVNTLSGLGDAIGSALATGGNVLQAAGVSLLSSLGSILSQLGQMAIQTGIGILAIKTALKTLNPFVAITAGVALVALGGLVSTKAKSLGNSMGSGSSMSTGGSYSSPASNGSYGSGSVSNNGGTVVFEISGQSLIGVLSNTLDRNSKLGGALGIS